MELSSEFCKKERKDLQNRKIALSGCMAQCLQLSSWDLEAKNNSLCNFDPSNGKAVGDPCTENFQATQNDKTVGCQFHSEVFSESSRVLYKMCDYIVFEQLLQWNRRTNVLQEHDVMIESAKPFIKGAKAAKIKIWLQVGTQNVNDVWATDWSQIASDNSATKVVIKVIADVMAKYGLDGVYIFWHYPGCPEDAACHNDYQRDRSGAISFFKELSATLWKQGRAIAIMAPLLDWDRKTVIYLGPEFQKTLTKYVNFTIFEASGQMSTNNPHLAYTRNLPVLINLMKAMFSAVGPGLKKKAILSRHYEFFNFILKSPNLNKINSKYNQTLSKRVSLPQLCELFKKNKYTKVFNVKNQHYAYSNESFVIYEDIVSIKAEMDEMVRNFDMAGVYLELLQQDDVTNFCGAGKMPFSRMYAEALKGGTCKFKPIL